VDAGSSDYGTGCRCDNLLALAKVTNVQYRPITGEEVKQVKAWLMSPPTTAAHGTQETWQWLADRMGGLLARMEKAETERDRANDVIFDWCQRLLRELDLTPIPEPTLFERWVSARRH
jgi:hypothetical protein